MVAALVAAVKVVEMVAWMQMVKAQGMWPTSSGSGDEEQGGVAAVGK